MSLSDLGGDKASYEQIIKQKPYFKWYQEHSITSVYGLRTLKEPIRDGITQQALIDYFGPAWINLPVNANIQPVR